MANLTIRKLDDAILASIESRFARRGLRMPAANNQQAMVPRGATVLANPNGTAPGLLIERGAQMIVLLPGPPREMRPMVDSLCETAWKARAGEERLYKASLFVTGRVPR